MAGTAVGLPAPLARRSNRVLRPRDAAGVYVQPAGELRRLANRGAARRLATGYYALVPQHRVSDPRWRPDPAAAALGIAQADYGREAVALMGTSAARHHGGIPRAIAVAVVAVPKQRPALQTEAGRVIFVERDTSRLDLERIETELTSGWVTTVEQTVLDLANRPTLGGLTERSAREAVRLLAPRTGWPALERLADAQHRPGALRRASTWAGRADA